MSDAKKEAPAEATEGEKPKKKLSLPFPLILGTLNTLVILIAVGLLAYTKLLFKRPQITEEGERERIAAIKAAPKPALNKGFLLFDPVTINIAATPVQPKAADGTASQIQGKLHYATIGFSLELPDMARKEELEAIKPLVSDQFLALVGHKQFHELTSVQGRYVMKTQLIEIVNGLAGKRHRSGEADRGPIITDIYFNQFIVQ